VFSPAQLTNKDQTETAETVYPETQLFPHIRCLLFHFIYPNYDFTELLEISCGISW